jgi:hypothetical protein
MRSMKTTTRAADSRPNEAGRSGQRSAPGIGNRRPKIFRLHNGSVEGLMGQKRSRPGGSKEFVSERQLARLTETWPLARLVGVWNRLPDVKRVDKFTDRKTAVRRIWKAVQTLEVSSGRISAKDQGSVSGAERDSLAAGARSRTTKTAQVVALLRQPSGATLKAIMAATGWQVHSVRGFISGQVRKRMGLKVQSLERDGERVYSIRS